MARVTANAVVARVERLFAILCCSRSQFEYDTVRRSALTPDCKVWSSVFLVNFSRPFPTDIVVSIVHVDVLEHIGWKVLARH